MSLYIGRFGYEVSIMYQFKSKNKFGDVFGGSKFSKMLKNAIFPPFWSPKSFVDPKLMHFLFWQYIWHKIRHYQALRYRKIKNGNEKRIFLLKFCSFSCIFNFWALFSCSFRNLKIEHWKLLKPPNQTSLYIDS